MSQEVPEVCFWGQSIPMLGSSVRPSVITPHFHEMHRCSPGASSASGYSHYELHRRLVDSSSVASVGSSASRCCSCPHERVGVTAKCQKKSVLSPLQRTTSLAVVCDSTSTQLNMPVTGTYRVHPVSCKTNSQSLTVKQF